MWATCARFERSTVKNTCFPLFCKACRAHRRRTIDYLQTYTNICHVLLVCTGYCVCFSWSFFLDVPLSPVARPPLPVTLLLSFPSDRSFEATGVPVEGEASPQSDTPSSQSTAGIECLQFLIRRMSHFDRAQRFLRSLCLDIKRCRDTHNII